MTTKAIHNHPSIKKRYAYSTVKVYLRQLLLEKQISQTFQRGTYEVIKTKYGVESGLRLHNIKLQVLGEVKISEIFDRYFGDVHIYVTFGVKKGKITGSIAKRNGLLWSEWIFARDLFLWKCEEVLSKPVIAGDVRILQGELGNDYLKRRISSIAKCVTLTDVNGFLQRIYQKDNTTVRREVTVRNTTIEDLELLWRGGLTPYNLLQTSATLINQNEKISRKMDRCVSIFSSVLELERERFKRDDRILAKISELVNEVKESQKQNKRKGAA